MIAPTKHSSQEFLLLHKSSFRLSLHAAGILLLVLLLIRASALPQLSSSYIGGFEGDGGLYIWLTQWNLSGLFSLPWFNTKAFYPYTRSLAWSDSYILPSLAAWPLVKLGASLALAFNLIILIANFLNGFLTYRLAYALTGKQEAALFAGISFMSLSSLTYNLGHPQLQFAFWLPLACHLFLMLLRAWSW
ncbi:MAG: hypothetical protein DCC75_13495, partial [Proteobacteria bacterium]